MKDKTCDTCRWYGLTLETPDSDFMWACMNSECENDSMNSDQSCDRWERMERPERKQDNGQYERELKVFFEAVNLCREHANGKTGIEGTVKCPKCNGKLNYSVSSYNGHLWGMCETQDCLAWME